MKEPKMMIPGKTYVRSAPTSDGDDTYMGISFVYEGTTIYGEFVFHLLNWTIDHIVYIPYSVVLPSKYSDGNWKEIQ